MRGVIRLCHLGLVLFILSLMSCQNEDAANTTDGDNEFSELGCLHDSDCSSGLLCQDGQCIKENESSCYGQGGCLRDGDCLSGLCQDDCVCYVKPLKCLSDSGCPKGMLCYEEACIPEDQNPCAGIAACNLDEDCESGQYCGDSCTCKSLYAGDMDESEEESEGEESDSTSVDCSLGPVLQAELTLDFGMLFLGQKKTRPFHLINLCSDPILINAVSISKGAPEYQFETTPGAPFTLQGNDSWTGLVVYEPANLGADEGEVLIQSNAVNPTLKIKLLSHYQGSKAISITPDPIAFGPVSLHGEAGRVKIVIGNWLEHAPDGNAALSVSAVRLESENKDVFEFSETPQPFILFQGETKSISLLCHPPRAEQFTDRVVIESDDLEKSLILVRATCQGVVPVLSVTPLTNGHDLDFGMQRLGFPVSRLLTLKNSGEGSLVVQTPILVQTPPDVFSLEAPAFESGSITLTAGLSETIRVAYAASALGEQNAQIRIDHNGQGTGVFMVNLHGETDETLIGAEPAQVDFSPTPVGEGASLPLILTNERQEDVVLKTITITEGEEHFAIREANASGAVEDVRLGAGNGLTLHVIFTPKAHGALSGRLHFVTDEAVVAQGDVILTGSGQAGRLVVRDPNDPNFAGVMEFGALQLGQSLQKLLSLANEGDAALNLSHVSISENSDDEAFSVTQPSKTKLETGESVNVVLTYAPTGTYGQDEGRLLVTCDDPDLPEKGVLLRGSALDPALGLSPESPMDFGTVRYGNAKALRLLVTNTGHAGKLTINRIEITEENEIFKLLSVSHQPPVQLAPNGQETLEVDLLFEPKNEAGQEKDFSGILTLWTDSVEVEQTEVRISLVGHGEPCPATCWDLDDDPTDCEYCGCEKDNDGLEICDGKDNDCNGKTDDGTALTDCEGTAHGAGVCDQGGCRIQCEDEFHLCESECLASNDPAHCGQSCIPCPEPANAEPTCEQTEGLYHCSFKCDQGYVWKTDHCALQGSVDCCNGTCSSCGEDPENGAWSCESDACVVYCAAHYHRCGEACVSDFGTQHCGTGCVPCPEPAEHGKAVCDGSFCGIQCEQGYFEQDGHCIACEQAAHCGVECLDCGELVGGQYQCESGACAPHCDGGKHLCGDRCWSDADAEHCGESCVNCGTLSNGQYLCQNQACVPNCLGGYHYCNGSCYADNDTAHCGAECRDCGSLQNGLYSCVSGACSPSCNFNHHFCPQDGGLCVGNGQIEHCGANCTPCPVPNGSGRAVCASDGTAYYCDVECDYPYVAKNGDCVLNSEASCCGFDCLTCTGGLNSHGVCSLQGADYACSVACNDNYWDLDGDGRNCETYCQFVSENDEPDDGFSDANCDGIDGRVNRSYFVAPPESGGANGNPGTKTNPMASIQEAINAANLDPVKKWVLISGGGYNGPITLASGVNLAGGYNAGSGWSRGTQNVAAVNVTASDGSGMRVGVYGHHLYVATVLDRLRIQISDNSSSGGSNFGLHVMDADALVVKNVRIVMGRGGNGSNGSDGLDAQTLGVAGGNGGNGCELIRLECSVFDIGDCDAGAPGGAGGVQNSCPYGAQPGRGGVGGTGGRDNEGSTINGNAGETAPNGGGNGGTGGICCSGSGENGSNGAGHGTVNLAGADGADAGGGAGIGTFIGGTYFPADGGSNQADGNGGRGGGGGGGGGGGNSAIVALDCPSFGGSGGGGGSGGCGGQKAQSGSGGGGVFGVLLVETQPSLQNVIVTNATGGAGGRGGKGGAGSSGGSGGAASSGVSSSDDPSGGGGAGGLGGPGGRGGHGGGGGGGPSYCFYSTNINALPTMSGCSCSQVAGGQGGDSQSHPGTNGLWGEHNW